MKQFFIFYCATRLLCYAKSMVIFTVIAFIVILSALILIHEFGHFLAARAFGVKAEEFGWGLPPRAIGVVRKDGKWKRVKRKDQSEYQNTIWSINWLPIGGFVRIKGEMGDSPHDKDSFLAKPVWKRFIIIAAGVIMNWIFAAVLFSLALMIGAPTVLDGVPAGATIKNREIAIVDVLPGSAAAKAGIQPLDAVVNIGGVVPKTVEDVQNAIGKSGSSQLTLLVKREGKDVTVTAQPQYVDAIKKYGLGISLAEIGNVSFPIHLALWNGVILTGDYTKATVVGFYDLFSELFHGGGPAVQSVSGPVGIAELTGKFAAQGVLALLQFTAILSINLAILNFLPIPALDGGRGVFLIYEGIFRRPVNRRVEAIAHNVAFIVLIALVLVITVRDVWRLIG
jgi:regulator of sigma E protease